MVIRANVTKRAVWSSVAVLTVLVGLLFIVSGPHVAAQGSPKSGFRNSALGKPFGDDARVVITPETLSAISQGNDTAWTPAINKEKLRGGVDVYSKVAPAVAVIRTSHGHGTGFFIRPDGTLVTNHHVVDSGLRHDPQRNASYALAHLGRLGPDGLMQLTPEPVRAYVLKLDQQRDLALLKVALQEGKTVPSLDLATTGARPGTDCEIVGHPASGLLWAYRVGQISGVGVAPRDFVGDVMARLAVSGPARAAFEERVSKEPSYKLLLSSTIAGPGDSGGPLVDATGAVIGVTHAVTSDGRQARFTHHIHLDELRQFLLNAPGTPIVTPPSPWNFGPRVVLRDLGDGGAPDALLAGEGRPEVILFDLDNDTPRQYLTEDGLEQLVAQRKWNFELAIDVRGSGYDVFYDTDNDGAVDLILTTDEASATAKERLVLGPNGRWRITAAGPNERLLDPQNFKVPALVKRMTALQSVFETLVR